MRRISLQLREFCDTSSLQLINTTTNWQQIPVPFPSIQRNSPLSQSYVLLTKHGLIFFSSNESAETSLFRRDRSVAAHSQESGKAANCNQSIPPSLHSFGFFEKWPNLFWCLPNTCTYKFRGAKSAGKTLLSPQDIYKYIYIYMLTNCRVACCFDCRRASGCQISSGVSRVLI